MSEPDETSNIAEEEEVDISSHLHYVELSIDHENILVEWDDKASKNKITYCILSYMILPIKYKCKQKKLKHYFFN